jgi:hypothetical protein
MPRQRKDGLTLAAERDGALTFEVERDASVTFEVERDASVTLGGVARMLAAHTAGKPTTGVAGGDVTEHHRARDAPAGT